MKTTLVPRTAEQGPGIGAPTGRLDPGLGPRRNRRISA
jgi:hypothetical protein